MPLRSRKTRSSGKTEEDEQTSPTSNGGRTHPKEMYAPDRATRSRTSSEDLVILDLPKSSRSLKRPTTPVKGKGSNRGDKLTSNSKAVNNGGASSQLNDKTPQISNRTRRRSGRLSGDNVEKETPKKTSPQTAVEQSSARSERRRRRSGNDDLDNSVNVTDNKTAKSDGGRHSGRRRSSTDDKSPVGRQDTVKETKKGSTINKKPDPEPPDGNFKVPSHKSKSTDNTLLESPRSSRRQSLKSASIDTVLSVDVDVDVVSNDTLSLRTSPRRPKASPRSDKKATKEGEKLSPAINNAPVSPRTRRIAAKQESENQEAKGSLTDSSRKRRLSGDHTLEADDTHSNRKRKKTGSVCRDLTSHFSDDKSEKEDANKLEDVDDLGEGDSDADKNEFEEDDNNTGSSELDPTKDNNSVSQSAKSDQRGTPTNSPRKSRSKSPGRSPSRRGLRSSGQAAEAIPSESSQPEQDEDSALEESVKTECMDTSGVESEMTPLDRIEDTSQNRTEDTTNEDDLSTKDDQGDELCLFDEDSKPDLGDFEEFEGDEWYEDVDDTELFFFESDHVALKGNRDYRMMLRTLSTLEAQRKQAVQDLDVLIDKKREALQNPLSFAQKLQQRRENVDLPVPQRVVVLPDVEWEKYLGAAEAIEMAGFKHQTRGAKSSTSKHSLSGPSSKSLLSAVTQLSQKSLPASQVHQSPRPSTSSTPEASIMDSFSRKDPFLVRGRAPIDPGNPNKPASFNQLWTVEEQRKLEEFLVKFPMEEVEARRWEKIARALGNRTPQQVASRVQKYFIKLTKAGLPVPGRIPNMTYYTNRKNQARAQRMHPFAKNLYQPSTFLQSVRPPVFMSEEDENIGWSGYLPGQDDDDDDVISDDESVPVELRCSDEYLELLRLKKMKKDKMRAQSLMSHQGYKCDGCSMEPIVGIRWHCIDCPADVSTDLCQACVDCDFSSPNHSSSHQMEPIQYNYVGGPSFVDNDYTRFTPSTGDYNYLDPNYNPAALPT